MNHFLNRKFLYVFAVLLLASAIAISFAVAPAAHAQTGIGVGYTGMHDGQRGRVVVFDYRPRFSHFEFSAGNISHTLNRDTTWAGVQYMII